MLLAVGGVQGNADDQPDDGQKDNARQNVHELEFTDLFNTTLYLPVHEINADAEQDAA